VKGDTLPLSENAVAGYDVALAPQTSRDLDQLDQELDHLSAAIEMLDNSTTLYQRPEGTSIDVGPQAQASDPEPMRSPVAARVASHTERVREHRQCLEALARRLDT
jgi:hypothetical protein